MKKLFLAFILGLAALPLFGISHTPFPGSVRFAETAVFDAVRGGSSPTSTIQTLNQTFTATLTVPGLTNGPFPLDAALEVQMGNFSLGGSLSQAEEDGDCFTIEDGLVKVCLNGPLVTFSGVITNVNRFILHPDLPGTTNGVKGYVNAYFRLGTFSHFGPVAYTANRTLEITPVGDQQIVHGRVQITGANDREKPTVSFLTPAANQIVQSTSLSVTGRAFDNIAVDRVEFRINGNLIANATLTSPNGWFLPDVALQPGTNLLGVTAQDFAGNRSAEATRKVIRTMPLTLNVDTNRGTVAGISNQQHLIPGATYRATATPRPGFVFANWTGSVTGTNPVLPFVMAPSLQLRANFAPDLWTVRKGLFNGLFCATNQEPSAFNSGALTLTLTEKGRFSGKLQLTGRMYPFSGAWNVPDDNANSRETVITIARGLAVPLTLRLTLALVEGEEAITGSLAEGSWTASLKAERVGDFGGAAPFAGYYTYVTVPRDPSWGAPEGSGPAMMTVKPNGNVNVAGTLGDGRPYTAGSQLGKSGDWPLNVPLNGKRGLLQGRVTVGRNSLASFPTDPFCPTATLLNQAFDSSDGGFVSTSAILGSPWTYNAGAGDWRVNGANSVGTNLSHARLSSPVLTVTRAGVVQVQFHHRYSFESDFDLGQLRMSVNGGAFQIVPASAFFQNAPSNSVVGSAFADLQRHRGFNGTSANHGSGQLITSAAALGRFKAGDRLILQFFAAWDSSFLQTSPNWAISAVTLIEGACYEVTGHEMKWSKSYVLTKDKFYPYGFFDEVFLFGHNYKPFRELTDLLPASGLIFSAAAGNSAGTLLLPLTVSNNTLKVSGNNPPGLKLTVNPDTGQFTHSYTNSFTGKLSAGKGVLLQMPNNGLRGTGFRLDTNLAGSASITFDP